MKRPTHGVPPEVPPEVVRHIPAQHKRPEHERVRARGSRRKGRPMVPGLKLGVAALLVCSALSIALVPQSREILWYLLLVLAFSLLVVLFAAAALNGAFANRAKLKLDEAEEVEVLELAEEIA